MEISLGIDKKLIFLVMIVAGIALSITAFLSFNYADQILRERTGDQLISESVTRGNAIRFLLQTRIDQNQIIATDPMVQLLVEDLNHVSKAELQTSSAEKRRDFLTQIQAFQTLVGFSIGLEDVKIIGINGDVYYSLAKIGVENFSNDPLFRKGLTGSFVDFEPAAKEGKKLIVVSPIYQQNSKKGSDPIGVIISKMRTEELDDSLENRSGLGETGEVYIVNDGFLMLSESRFIPNAIFNQRVDTIPVRECFKEGREFVGFYFDYRNVPIYGSSFCAKDLGFVLLAEIDEAETVKPILVLQDRIFQTGLLITTGMAIVAFIISKTISRPLIKLKNAANRIAEGNFNVRTQIKTRDEIGELSSSFDYMVSQLQKSLLEIKEKEEVIKQQEDILLNFSDHSENDCVCLIDIKDSTKVTSRLSDSQSSKLYSTFLNSMASIVRTYRGTVVKNIGDALLFYFNNPDLTDEKEFKNIIECCLAMSEAHSEINKKLNKEGLPSVDYKISATYGSVRVAKIVNSDINDIFGTTVNKCAKINQYAPVNGFVIGKDLYEIVKNQNDYNFTKILDSNHEFGFIVYEVKRKNHS